MAWKKTNKSKIIDCLHNQTYIVQSQDGTTYRRNWLHIRPTKIEAVIRDKSLVRFENKRRQAEISHEEKTTTSHEPFILTEKKTPHNSNSITPTNIPCGNRDPLKNSMQETPAGVEPETIPLRRSSRIRKEPEKLKDFVRYWLCNPFESHFTFWTVNKQPQTLDFLWNFF